MANSNILFLFSLILFTTTLVFSQSTPPSCKSMTFSNQNTFDNCIDLPTLNAILHYTYNPTQSTFTMAFTATPPDVSGWVAWALNPKSTGMGGSQALMAYKPTTSGPITLNTLDIESYSNIIEGPISYNVTNLSAEESDGYTTIFATWVIPSGQMSVNTVWQVGPIVDGKPGAHAFESENLESTMALSLTNGPSGAPLMSPEGIPDTVIADEPTSAFGGGADAPVSAPVTVAHTGGAQKNMVSVIMVLGVWVLLWLFGVELLLL